MMHWFNDYGMGPSSMGGMGPVFMIFFWGLVVWGVISLIRVLSAKKDGESRQETAEEIVKKRYAGGEINKEEFDAIRKDLQS